MKRLSLLLLMMPLVLQAQIDSFQIHHGIKVTIDRPQQLPKKAPLIVVFFALPNGNNTDWTMGKKMETGDDWHYDIQHIRAQTGFVRQHLPGQNIVVIYLENNLKAWPAWKKANPDYPSILPGMIDSLSGLFKSKHKSVYLNGHSGGGSFIFGYLASVKEIPGQIKRISFLDSDYGYDSSYYPKFRNWLQNVPDAALNVFAYNDSVALYNGKRVVSDTGGTWYRSHKFIQDLQRDFVFNESQTDSIQIFKSADQRIQFYLKPNFNQGIYHTKQVEFNGFIHSLLCGTKQDSQDYQYYGPRAYSAFIQ